jgi:acetyl-CoA C-acetyltransferase
LSLKGVAAITGYAEIGPTKTPGLTPLAMSAQLAREAVLDAGFEKNDVDGLITTTPHSTYSLYWSTVVGQSLGMNLRYFDTVDLGGASGAGMIWRAAAAIQAGLCRNVLCIIASTNSGGGTIRLGDLAPKYHSEFDTPYGISMPNAGYAMIARRHMYEYGTTGAQMAKIAVDQRSSALLNPTALFNHKPLSIDEVLGSPLVFDPLHLFEVVSRCSGGAAVVVSSREVARRAKNPPVYLLGAGEAGTHLEISSRPNVTESWIKNSGETALAMAGVSPPQVDTVQLYDCYTITVLVTIEDLGFCAKGHGGPYVAERDLSFSGDLPCNTNGGQLSMGQPGTAGGMIHITEAARQLMGRAGPRQVNAASLAIAHGNGGVMGDQVTLILANQ